jgi:glycopeptide antibiotics resistance protein
MSRSKVAALLAAYLVALVALTFFPFDGLSGSEPVDLRLQAFRTINFALRKGFGSLEFLVLIGNLAAFVPLGMLIPLVFGRRSLALVLMGGLAVSLAIELGQLALSIVLGFAFRSADIDDVIVNVCGAALGYLLFLAVAAFRTRREAPPPDRRASY